MNSIPQHVRPGTEGDEELAPLGIVIHAATDPRLFLQSFRAELYGMDRSLRGAWVYLNKEIIEALNIVTSFRQPDKFH